MHGVDMDVCAEVMMEGGDRVDVVPPGELSE